MSKMQLGVIVRLGAVPEEALQKVADLELPTCQLAVWNESLATPGDGGEGEGCGRADRRADQRSVDGLAWTEGVELHRRSSHLGAGAGGVLRHAGTGPHQRFPLRRRARSGPSRDPCRLHSGNPSDPLYPGLVASLRYIVRECRANGQTFCFETGQETPTTLLRVFEDLGGENVGVNLDPANLAMYGKANPERRSGSARTVDPRRAREGRAVSNGRAQFG